MTCFLSAEMLVAQSPAPGPEGMIGHFLLNHAGKEPGHLHVLRLGAEIGRARVGKECRSRWSPYY